MPGGLDDPEFTKLSARELECARLVAKGYSNKEVGQLLGISHWTVAAHIKATFLKHGVRRRVELAYLLRRQI
jgi:DNA-binding CsgD family transcriptional regulator